MSPRAYISGEKSQSQNSIQLFEFPRTFFSTGRPAILPAGPLLLDCHCWKKCGKIQNVISSSDFEIFSPQIHALVFWGMSEGSAKFTYYLLSSVRHMRKSCCQFSKAWSLSKILMMEKSGCLLEGRGLLATLASRSGSGFSKNTKIYTEWWLLRLAIKHCKLHAKWNKVMWDVCRQLICANWKLTPHKKCWPRTANSKLWFPSRVVHFWATTTSCQ